MVKVHWTLKELLAEYPRPWSLAHVRDPGAYPYVIYDARGLVIPTRIPERLLIELVGELEKPKSPQKPATFREGMLICALNDPEDRYSFEIYEVIVASPEGLVCDDRNDEYTVFYADEFENRRIFHVGYAVKRWFRSNEWVYGVNHPTMFVGEPPPPCPDPFRH